MKEVARSAYLAQKKPIARALLDALLEKYEYASVLVTDVDTKSYSVRRSGVQISQDTRFGSKGMVVKVYDGNSYAEYSTNNITMDAVPAICEEISSRLMPMADKLPEGLTLSRYKKLSDEPCTFRKATTYEQHPGELGDEAIVNQLGSLREKTLA